MESLNRQERYNGYANNIIDPVSKEEDKSKEEHRLTEPLGPYTKRPPVML